MFAYATEDHFSEPEQDPATSPTKALVSDRYPFRGLVAGTRDRHRVAVPEGPMTLSICRVHTLSEVAETLGVSLRQVELLIRDGDLAAVNVGRGRQRRDLRVLDDALQTFVEARRVEVSARRTKDRLTERKIVKFEPGGYAETRKARLASKEDRS